MEPDIGSLLGDRYSLTEHLHTSLMSTVFKAWDSKEQCLVVVKVATNTRDHLRLVKYLRREAKALKRFNHPRIVRLLDSGHFKESHFLVLEYVDGGTLETDIEHCRDMWEDYPSYLSRCISLTVEILEGLEVLHKQGLIHRDLKPGNLMVSSSGIKIIDLGLVKSVPRCSQPLAEPVNTNIAVGTVGYVSPEQACGSPDLDCRSDLYACGVILYQLLTGASPFRGLSPYHLTFDYLRRPLLQFSEAAPSLPISKKVKAIVWKALQVDPNLRFQTAAEMREALLKVLSEPPQTEGKFKRFFGKVWKVLQYKLW